MNVTQHTQKKKKPTHTSKTSKQDSKYYQLQNHSDRKKQQIWRPYVKTEVFLSSIKTLTKQLQCSYQRNQLTIFIVLPYVHHQKKKNLQLHGTHIHLIH